MREAEARALRWLGRVLAACAMAGAAALAAEGAGLWLAAGYLALAIAWAALLLAGGAAFLRLRRHLAPGARTATLAALAGVLLAPAALLGLFRDPGYEWHRLRRALARSAPAPGQGRILPPDAAEQEAFDALGERLDAALVWSSNCAGTADLWYRHRFTAESVRLTESGHADAEPCFARSGTEVFFTRYESADRDARKAAILCVRPQERLPDETYTEYTVTSGFAPRVSPDGRWLVFSRADAPGRTSVWRMDLARAREKIEKPLLPDARVPRGRSPSRPALAPGGLTLAFELASRLRGSAVGWLDLAGGALAVREGARSASWSPDGKRLAWCDTRGGAIWAAGAAAAAPGRPERLYRPPRGMVLTDARWSNHPRFLALAAEPVGLRGAREVCVLDLERGTCTPVTFHTSDDAGPDLYVRSVKDGGGS